MTGADTLNHRRLQCVYAAATVFFAATCWVSYARWANFEYRTFDLAYYIQAIWQLIHGRLQVSVEHVPLLGNHVEPIVILFAPLFALFQHPMLFVVVQNAALATMAPVGYSVARRLGIGSRGAALLALALLVTPATGYIALHEFHPEALTAPLLLLMLQARVAGWLGRHWLWFVAVLSCKENMALVLAAYCAVNLIIERRRPHGELRAWYGWPLAAATGWFILCTKVITPALNSGDIDYLALYSRLGDSAAGIVLNAFREPHLIIDSLRQSVQGGNLLWGLLLPFLALPILRSRWLVIASPILLQHLLSWRSSEWTIYFHYAAPLVPLLWIASVEVIAGLKLGGAGLRSTARTGLPGVILIACIGGQAWLGPAAAMAETAGRWSATKRNRDRKDLFISAIPADASVLAPLPYLSHLAAREKLYSLHYVLKGLKTLSRSTYEPPPPTDFVLLDYDDTATFDSSAGYYHPAMKTADGRIIASSDQLLHNFLMSSAWSSVSRNELTLLKRENSNVPAELPGLPPVARIGENTELLRLAVESDAAAGAGTWRLLLNWNFEGERQVFPWLLLKLVPKGAGAPVNVTRGLCAPEVAAGAHGEIWTTDIARKVADGDYAIEAVFIDNSQRSWLQSKGQPGLESTELLPPIPLGELHASGRERILIPR